MNRALAEATNQQLLVGLVVVLVLAAGLCVVDGEHAGIDLCFAVLAVTLQMWGLLSPTPMGRVVASAIPRTAVVPQRPPDRRSDPPRNH